VLFRSLASASQDGTVCLWTTDIKKPRQVAVLDGSKDGVLSVAFAVDGKVLGAGGNDRAVHLWEYNGDQFLHQRLEGHQGPVQLVLFPVDGRTLLSGDASHRIILWDLASRTMVKQWLLPAGSTVAGIACTGDGRYLAAGKVGIVTIFHMFAKSKELVELAV